MPNMQKIVIIDCPAFETKFLHGLNGSLLAARFASRPTASTDSDTLATFSSSVKDNLKMRLSLKDGDVNVLSHQKLFFRTTKQELDIVNGLSAFP